MMIENAYNNYNLFIVSLGTLILSLNLTSWKRKIILLISVILLLWFSYNQFRFFPINKMNSFNDYKVTLSNLLFSLFAIYLCFHLIKHHIFL